MTEAPEPLTIYLGPHVRRNIWQIAAYRLRVIGIYVRHFWVNETHWRAYLKVWRWARMLERGSRKRNPNTGPQK